MKIQKLECPYCTGPLDIVRDRVIHYCPHCGKPLAISDENTVTVHKNIYVKKDSHSEKVNRIIDEGKVTEERRLIEEEKTTRIIVLTCIGSALLLFIFGTIFRALGLM